MRKTIFTFLGVFALATTACQSQETQTEEKKEAPPASQLSTEADLTAPPVTDEKLLREMKSKEASKLGIYAFKVKDINGKEFDFAKLKGKKILIVNTASNCGYTPQYKELEELSKQMKDQLVIVGFPSNDFGAQEPGSNKEIAQFCEKNYGVTFPMMEKISVKGEQMHELYAYLTQKSQNGYMDSKVEWNFQKYLIGANGKLIQVFPSKNSPLGPEIMAALKK